MIQCLILSNEVYYFPPNAIIQRQHIKLSKIEHHTTLDVKFATFLNNPFDSSKS